VGLSFLLAFIPVMRAESQELHGLLTSSFTLTESEVGRAVTEFEGYRQTLDLNWRKVVTPYLSYRISLRGEEIESRTTVEPSVTETSSLLLEPSFDVSLAAPGYSLTTGLRLRELVTDGNRIERVRLSDRHLFARLFLTQEGLPPLSILVDRTTSVDDREPRTRDSEETRYQVSTRYAFKGLNLSYTFSDQIGEDHVARRTRDQMNHLGSLGYAQTFFQERLTLLGNYSVNYTRTREAFFIPSLVARERGLKKGLKAGPDPTPENSADVPLTEEPALLAGTASVPLELFVSVGFELAIREPVGEIRIPLAPEPPFSLPGDLQVFLNFRVFSSDDPTLTFWTEVRGVSQRFDSLESRFSLIFPPTTARFFKVFVSRNDFGALVKATGVTALESEVVAAGTERVTSSLLHTLGAGLTFRPIRMATASFNLTLTDVTQEPDSRRTTSGVQTASLVVIPHRLLTTTLTYQHSFTDSNQPGVTDTTADTYSLTFSSSPLPTLTSAFSLALSENRSEGELQNRSGAASLNIAAKLYRNLNVNPTLSLSKTRDFTTGQESLGQTLALNLNAILTSRLSTILGYTFHGTRTEGPGLNATTASHTGSAAFTYTLSRQLNVNSRFDLSNTAAGTSLSQDYRVDWVPTFKTSFFVNYRRTDQQVRGVTGGSDAIALNGRWNISRYLDLSANYTFFRGFTGDTVHSFFGSLGFRF